MVAHGAGNSIEGVSAARADVVEADVHLFGGRLELRHAKTVGPLPVLWDHGRLVARERPPRVLEDLLAAVPPELRLMLDLKGPDPRLPGAVARATTDFARARGLIVSARIWRTADRLRGLPGVRTIHSAGSARGVRALLRRYRPGALEGVAVHRRLLTPGLAAALRERADWLWSWPVDDAETAALLRSWGVTGLISDAPERLWTPAGASAGAEARAGGAAGSV